MSDEKNLRKLMERIRPDEVYNLASQSHVGISFEMPEYSTDVNALGTLRLLEAIHDYAPESRMFQASSSELFGEPRGTTQSESTPFAPNSPYAVAKLYAYWMVKNYRRAYGLYACNGIMFNHESPRRGENFVTRKITRTVARIATTGEGVLDIGNLDAQRDWGYAPDYVRAMWLMLQQEQPDDFVLATGELHSVREFVERAFEVAGIALEWIGSGEEEQGIDTQNGRTLVQVNPRYYRPLDASAAQGDASKAKKVLNWEPSIRFNELVEIMVQADIEEQKGLDHRENSHR
jgi:GDPmannose 4,6-dehydratase